MVLPLGPLFAIVYMCFIENKTLNEASPAPTTYCRYVDDVFVEVQSLLKVTVHGEEGAAWPAAVERKGLRATGPDPRPRLAGVG